MSDRVQSTRWGILGTAQIAGKIATAISLAEGAELTAIASRSQARARDWAASHEVPRAYGSYMELLDDAEIDAVYIPLPPSMHAEWTIKAAERGKHILCEKPIATNVSEAAEMVSACRENGVQLMDGVMWVHHERTREMKQVLDSGQLGELRRVNAAFSISWNVVAEDNIRGKRELGGGSLGDLGYYCVRAVLWAFEGLPTRVLASARYQNGVDFNLAALLWFDGERVASIDCGFDTTFRNWLEVAGTDGWLRCERFTAPVSRETASFQVRIGGEDPIEKSVDGCIQEAAMIERFGAAVRSGEIEESWSVAAINAMRVCDALAASAEREAVVSVT